MIAWWLIVGLAHAGVVATPPPEVGVTSSLVLTDDEGELRRGATTAMTSRPGLPREHTVGLGVSDARGKVRLQPERGGVVLLEADGHRVGAIRVAWPSPPASTWVSLLLVALSALGSALVGNGVVDPWRDR